MKTLERIAEFFSGAIIISGPFWGSWLYYIITGRYLQF